MQTMIMIMVSRIYLLIVGYLSRYFPVSSSYPDKSIYSQGFALVPEWFLDMWYRWDSGWYLSIIKNGYQDNQAGGDVHAFFPLFPGIVKALVQLFPANWHSDATILILGLLVSNICLVVSMWLLAKLIRLIYSSEQCAYYTILILAFFPTSFIFSSFYGESLFLLLSVATYYFVVKQRWYLVTILSILLTLTRPTGVLIIVPLFVELITKSKSKLGPVIAMFGSLASFAYIGQDAVAAQNAWGKAISWPWTTLLEPMHFTGYITSIDKWVSLTFVLLGIYTLKKSPRVSFAWYGIAMFIPFLFTGTLQSATRYCMLCYPLIAQGACWMTKQKSPLLSHLVINLLVILQTILFVAWVRFYWAT